MLERRRRWQAPRSVRSGRARACGKVPVRHPWPGRDRLERSEERREPWTPGRREPGVAPRVEGMPARADLQGPCRLIERVRRARRHGSAHRRRRDICLAVPAALRLRKACTRERPQGRRPWTGGSSRSKGCSCSRRHRRWLDLYMVDGCRDDWLDEFVQGVYVPTGTGPQR